MATGTVITVYDQLSKLFANFVVTTPQCGVIGGTPAPSMHAYSSATPEATDVCQCGAFYYAGAQLDAANGGGA
jgi:hypothetical protein